MSGWEEELAEEAFAAALERALGDRIRQDDFFTMRAWGSIANVTWMHPVHGKDGLTWRAAGSVLARIYGKGGYMDWYMSSPAGVVDEDFRIAMAAEGWTPEKA